MVNAEPLHLSKPDSFVCCTISPDIAKHLKPHQVYGLRFLYRNVLKNEGAIFNDDEDLGKKVTTAALLHAFFSNNSAIISSVLILCFDETQADKWHYILQTFSGLETQNFDSNDIGKHIMVVKHINLPYCNLEFRMINKFDCIIVEWHNLKAWYVVKNVLSVTRTNRRIMIASHNLINNLKELWECTEWVHPGLLGSCTNFLHKYGTNELKMQLVLSSLLRNIFLRRERHSINPEDLPLVDAKGYQKCFEDWKENQQLKLFLSDSQTSSSHSESLNNNLENSFKQQETTDELTASNSKDLPSFKPPLSSEDSIDTSTSESFNITERPRKGSRSPSTFTREGAISPDLFEEDNENLMESNKCSKPKKSVGCLPVHSKRHISDNSSESPEIVSAHVISPSNYTSDETFEGLNLLFPIDGNKVRKRRAPKRQKITNLDWLSCPKSTISQFSNKNCIDLMSSSDESNLHPEVREAMPKNVSETADEIIDRTLINLHLRNDGAKISSKRKSTNNQRIKSTRDNEAESILDSIFFT